MKILCVYPRQEDKDFLEQSPEALFDENEIEVWVAYCYEDALSYIEDTEEVKAPFDMVLTDAFIPAQNSIDNKDECLFPMGLEFVTAIETTLIRGLGIFMPSDDSEYIDNHNSQHFDYHAILEVNNCVDFNGGRDWLKLYGM